jgi:HK97 family phage portal protein
MGVFDRFLSRERRDGGNPLENPGIPLSASYEDFLRYFGQIATEVQLPPVTIETAMEVPAVLTAVAFLSKALASLPLHAYKRGGAVPLDGDIEMLLNEAPNAEWTSFGWRQYFWQQVFTHGRAPTWIERQGPKAVALWPMDPNFTTVLRRNGQRFYLFGGNEYPASDVIDVPFMLKSNQLDVISPIYKGRQAIGLALAMNKFATTFFGSGGVPPLALSGPLPQGQEAFNRAQKQINSAIEMARKSGNSFFGMPPGHELKPIGIDPDKGQMTTSRTFQLQEIARLYQMPPVFLQDLTNNTFTNAEQQDLQLIKHTIMHWTTALAQELNLKIFGQRNRAKVISHDLTAAWRGDFTSWTTAIAKAVQSAQLTPNEARRLNNLPPVDKGDELYIQGATVPLGTQPVLKAPADGDEGNGGRAQD